MLQKVEIMMTMMIFKLEFRLQWRTIKQYVLLNRAGAESDQRIHVESHSCVARA